MAPMSFHYASVACASCTQVTYYRREMGVSARQITLLAAVRCRACGSKVAGVSMSRMPPPEGSEVIELPDDDSIV